MLHADLQHPAPAIPPSSERHCTRQASGQEVGAGVLRACGRALFREIGRRWEAGEIRFDAAAGNGNSLSAEDKEAQRALARSAFEISQALRYWSHWSPRSVYHLYLYQGFTMLMVDLVYLLNLAESRGFQTVVCLIDKACLF